MRILKARLFEIAEKKQKEELAELTGHKKEIAFGSQIRSYTFHPEQRSRTTAPDSRSATSRA